MGQKGEKKVPEEELDPYWIRARFAYGLGTIMIIFGVLALPAGLLVSSIALVAAVIILSYGYLNQRRGRARLVFSGDTAEKDGDSANSSG